jgi:hypothetical protein
MSNAQDRMTARIVLTQSKQRFDSARAELAPIVRDDIYDTPCLRQLIYEDVPAMLAELEEWRARTTAAEASAAFGHAFGVTGSGGGRA